MRIALAIAGPYPALRGSQVLVRHLTSGLATRGHEIHVVSHGARADERPGLHPGRLVRDLALILRLWRCVRREAVEIIHAHNYEAAIAGLLVARLTGRPLVYHGHNALAEELPTYFQSRLGRRLASAVGRFLDGQVPCRADYCIAVTEELGELLRWRGVRASDLACLVPTGPPEERHQEPPAGRPSTGLVCYAGNLDRYQNLEALLRSFVRVRQEVPDATLVLVTHVPSDVSLMAPPRLLQGVEVVRARSYGEMRERLASADVAVCPRVERSGFPMKLLNYMAAGKAIVASAASAKGLIDGVTGRVVADSDEEAFGEAIVALLRDPGERERLGLAARQAVESPRAWEDVLDRLEEIYRRVLAPRSGAAPSGWDVGGARRVAGLEAAE
ncbi:MAG TPA: glycosyltransferase family 4 protein [Candidatus Binatus sp.]|jgi:glycosyltransferase involved in cell wall biosynthesis|nr:glycosyltransferase family 4 protein [Candidatus Binatus sp.]